MSINKYESHLFVLPEDRANEQIVNGFITNMNVKSGVVKVLPPADGWINLVDEFVDDHATEIKKYPKRMMILLMDFDKDYPNRLKSVQDRISKDIKDRVFIVGVLSEPERLRTSVSKSFKDIGRTLSEDCYNKNYNGLWIHALLRHNTNELNRMISSVRHFIF